MSKDLDNYEAQSELLRSLNNNSRLVELSKGGFHNRVADSNALLPRIVYSELNNRPTGHADNEEREVKVNFQVSIFTNSQTVIYEKEMTKLIDSIMKSLYYLKYDSQGLYEEDTKLHHKALRYEKNFY